MKYSDILFLLLVFSAYSLQAQKAPHVIILLADDLGYADVSYNGGNIKTPNIDKLCGEGIKLTNYYVHPICSPSRAALMTGRYSQNVQFSQVLIGPTPYGLDDKFPTLAQELKKRNYETQLVGKWHLGHSRWKFTPIGKGFDHFYGLLNAAGGHYSKYLASAIPKTGVYDLMELHSNKTWRHFIDETHSTKLFTSEAIKIMKTHNEEKSSKPLFLFVAYTAVHTPLQSDPEWMEKCRHLPHPARQAYCGLTVGVDESVKNLTLAISKYLGDNVVIIFSTDNGGHPHVGGINTPLRGGKVTSWEGGVRGVGFIVDKSKKYLGPQNSKFEGMIHISDWMPTILSIVDKETPIEGIKLPVGLDGHDMTESLKNNDKINNPRKDVVLHMSWHTSSIAYRQGPWKLIMGYAGNGPWSTEPQQWIIPNAGLIEKVYELLNDVLEKLLTRDESFFWQEILHLLVAHLKNKLEPGRDFSVLDAVSKNSKLFAYNQTIVSDSTTYTKLFNLEEDLSEKNDLSAERPEIVQELLKNVNKYWKAQPVQHEAHHACLQGTKFVGLEVEPSICSNRVSHLYQNIEQASVTNTVKCQFDHPWVEDDDNTPCGPKRELILVIEVFIKLVYNVIYALLVVVVGAVMAFLLFVYCCCCRRKSVKKLPKLKKN